MSPRQSRNRLLRDWFGPRRRERLHVLQAPGRQTTHARELRSKIRREAIHDPAAPALGVPTIQDQPTDPPIHGQKLRVCGPCNLQPGYPHFGLDLRHEVAITPWDERVSHWSSVAFDILPALKDGIPRAKTLVAWWLTLPDSFGASASRCR